ncbi:uncharacterized protein LOC143725967 [Siphateles boraxobius]|uniref:uncharacterized protein LOC143725967 n=1 Tax=Siphateles boraxobius TaxID=180520 RepID=UPI0040644E3F
MESSSTNVEDVTCWEILPDLPTKEKPVAAAEEPLSEGSFTRKASEIHVGHLKSEEPPTADAKVPEDEEPKTVDAEQALLEDKELLQIADIVEEISQITQEQETVSQTEESEELLKHDFKETLVVAEEPLTTSVEPVLVPEEEISPGSFEIILAANSKASADEESWVIIEEPARPLNVSVHSGRSEEPALKSKCNSAESTQILSQLRSICTKALEDSSYKPLSVDVCADESIIRITFDVFPDEFTCLNKVSYDKQCSFNEKGSAWTNSPHAIHLKCKRTSSFPQDACHRLTQN